tara:strand:+ start:395 stop:829 length:435 start_codon:yes stop_codon:yes gene_type:complete
MTKNINAVQFSSNHSVSGQSLLDLTLSYNNNVIAQTRGNLTVGNEVLVFARNKGVGLHVYAAIIIDKLAVPSPVWQQNGGNLWAHNWSITPVSDVIYLTEPAVRNICGPDMTFQMCNSSFMGSGKSWKKVGSPRAKLYAYLKAI